MKRVSISALNDYNECHLRYHYKYERHLRRKTEARTGIDFGASGSAAHFGFEARLAGKTAAESEDAALMNLHVRIGEMAAAKFEKGVISAMRAMPSDILEHSLSQSEQKIEQVYSIDPPVHSYDRYTPYDLMVVGKPDLWYIDDEGVINVWDFKTTGKDPKVVCEDLDLWSPQLRNYGVLILDWLRDQGDARERPVFIGHCVVSTKGVVARTDPSRYMTKQFINDTRAIMLAQAALCGEDMTPAEGPFNCKSCDMSNICEMRLTGGDIEGIIKLDYDVHEYRGEKK
jgi:hypothetical protein